MASLEDELASTAYYVPFPDPQFGEFVHSNNVLFYFASSPFFDKRSVNESVFQQSVNNPQFEFENLSTRKRFEDRIGHLRGIQYFVEHDPLESKAKYIGPQGEEWSDVWVIRKQERVDGGEGAADVVNVLAYYYIMNSVIYQAPSVASVLAYRFLNTSRTMTELCSASSRLAKFSVTHGHSYHDLIQRQTAPGNGASVSKEATPMPGSHGVAKSKAVSPLDSHDINVQARTLREALSLTMRYGEEYMDENPLYGEPGNFRLDRSKDTVPLGNVSGLQVKATPGGSKTGTSAPTSRAVSPPLQIQTDVPPATSKKSSTRTEDGGNPMKPKRRKSKIANPSPGTR